MKFASPVQMKKGGPDWYKIRPVDPKDCKLFDKALSKAKNGDDTVYETEIALPERERSYDQLKAAWSLIGAIFQSDSEEHRRGTKEELYGLYLDLLDVYAMKCPCPLSGNLRPIHISKDDPECTMGTTAYFVEGLMLHLATLCQLPDTVQTQVRGLMTQWIAWRGGLEDDPLDQDTTVSEWRERHQYSEASGNPGPIERAHIVSRGADQADIEEPWNWIALTTDEHRLQHAAGWTAFLAKYPHLQKRVERARRKAGKLGITFTED